MCFTVVGVTYSQHPLQNRCAICLNVYSSYLCYFLYLSVTFPKENMTCIAFSLCAVYTPVMNGVVCLHSRALIAATECMPSVVHYPKHMVSKIFRSEACFLHAPSGCSTLSFTFFIACSIIPGCSDLTFSMQISVFHADFLMRLWRYWQLLNVSASTVKPWYNGYNKLSDITNSYVHSTNIVLEMYKGCCFVLRM